MDHINQVTRLNRIEGQVRGIKKMIEDKRYCIDILTQLRSVSAALARVQDNILKAHLEGCVRDSLTEGEERDRQAKVDEILELLEKFR